MKKLLTALLCFSLLTGCAPLREDSSQKAQIFASFYVVEDFVNQIGKDKAEVTTLAKNGSVHDFEISATQMAALCKSDLFVYMGGADHWAEYVAKTAANDGCRTLALCSDLTKEHIEDYHLWLDPDNAIEQMERICTYLSEADSENAEYFRGNLETAKEKYKSLKEKTQELKRKTQGKTIVVSHGAYGYLCEELGMNQLAIEGIHGESDPTAAQMAQIIDYVKENNIKYIFASPNENSKSAQTVSSETGAQVLYLDSLESDNESGGYFEAMQKNLEQIEKSLGDL